VTDVLRITNLVEIKGSTKYADDFFKKRQGKLSSAALAPFVAQAADDENCMGTKLHPR
jgi:hypothetical protein